MNSPRWTLHPGDCREIMAGLPAGSVDAIVCDPPYELGFMGKRWDRSGIAFDAAVWRECLRVLKPGGHLVAFGGTRTFHRLVCAVEDAGFEIRDQLAWLFGSGFPKSLDVGKEMKKLSAEAEAWQGFGTGLKPGHEPTTLARKPLMGTVVQNVKVFGTGALNVEGCRVEAGAGDYDHPGCDERSGVGVCYGAMPNKVKQSAPADGGRWPANVLHDGSAGVLSLFPFEDGPPTEPRRFERVQDFAGLGEEGGAFAQKAGSSPGMVDRGDKGSAARFFPCFPPTEEDWAGWAEDFQFYCAKASRADREEGLEMETLRAGGVGALRDGSRQSQNSRRNHHPTVKPTALMRWLCRLITPPGGVVLDPFCGSGSTGKAAVLEGFRFIGCELTPEYLPIIRARLEHAEAQRLHEESQDLFFTPPPAPAPAPPPGAEQRDLFAE